jgi:outer membrane protein OmpA-like peptidoglycan-associated protein
MVLLALCCTGALRAQIADSSQEKLNSTKVAVRDSNMRVSVRNIDITRFPNIGVVFDVFDSKSVFMGGLHKEDIVITENGKPQQVESLSLITSANRVPIDFVFCVDQTGSMRDKIEAIKQNIDDFTTRLAAKGIDYRLGLITFDDNVAGRFWLTDDLSQFKNWIGTIVASGGGDEPENALEALRASTGMNFRSSANRCVVLITDAPYHEYSSQGFGRTMYTPRTISTILNRYDIRTFCITPTSIAGYHQIANSTGGQLFDIEQSFSDILNQFVTTMTALYSATYRSKADLIPDSIQVEVQLPGQGVSTKKRLAVLEAGRKLVVDNIYFGTNQYTIVPGSAPELDNIVRLMKARPTLRLKIEGHTDDVGDHFYNMKLSTLRADAVKGYIVQRGISANRLFTIGYGETRPTASNDTEDGRRLNRRTEFIIVQK